MLMFAVKMPHPGKTLFMRKSSHKCYSSVKYKVLNMPKIIKSAPK